MDVVSIGRSVALSPQRVGTIVNSTANIKLSTMGKIFVLVLLTVIFEGALRKWVSDALTMPLVLLRDCFATYGIFWAAWRGYMVRYPSIKRVLLIWTVCLLSWGVLQLIVTSGSPFIFIIGLRFWLLYLWFGFAAAVSLTEYDLNYVVKLMMRILLLLTPLIVVQFFSPPGAFINRQLDGDEDKVFRLTADIVRTTGVFTFTAGQSTFLAFVAPIVLAALTKQNSLVTSKRFPLLVAIALFIQVMLSGSRGALATFMIQFVCFVALELIYIRRSSKQGGAMLWAAMAGLAVIPLIFSSAVDATRERIESASGTEDFFERVWGIIFSDLTWDAFSFIGYGIGAGTNFAGFQSVGVAFALGEVESTRTLQEGGAMGLIFIFIKLATVFVGVRKSLRVTMRTGNALPAMLWLTMALALFMWSIHGQLTINALGYLLFGLALASLRVENAMSLPSEPVPAQVRGRLALPVYAGGLAEPRLNVRKRKP